MKNAFRIFIIETHIMINWIHPTKIFVNSPAAFTDDAVAPPVPHNASLKISLLFNPNCQTLIPSSPASHLILHPDWLGPGPGHWEGVSLPGAARARVVRGGDAGHGAGPGGSRVYRRQQHRLRVQHRLLFRFIGFHDDEQLWQNWGLSVWKEWNSEIRTRRMPSPRSTKVSG